MRSFSGHADKEWQTKVLKRELVRQTRKIVSLAENLEEGRDYANETPRKFAHIIGITAHLLGADLGKAKPSIYLNVKVLLDDLGAMLRYVERSRIAHTPWSMIQATESFLKECSGNKAHFLIRPQWAYNYGVSWEWIGALRKTIAALNIIDMSEWEKSANITEGCQIYCISFPRFEKTNALLHSLLGHEVGHIITQRVVEEQFKKIWQTEEQKVKTELTVNQEKKLGDIENELVRSAIVSEFVSSLTVDVSAILKQGLKELIADAIGLHVFGPAAFAALMEFACRADIDADPLECKNYPPWRYRLRTLGSSLAGDIEKLPSEFEKNAQHAKLKPFLHELQTVLAIIDDRKDLGVITGHPETLIAYRLIEQYLPSVLSEAIKSLPEKIQEEYLLSKHYEEVTGLLNRLEADIPPNETGDWPNMNPAQLADILNAGWAFKYLRLSEGNDWETDPEKSEALFRLILKAIESSHIHRTFGPKIVSEEGKTHEHPHA